MKDVNKVESLKLKGFRYIALLVCSLYSVLCTPLHAQFNTDRITSIGRNALYFEDFVLSIQYFNQVIRLKPYLAEPYFFRAIAKIQLEDYQGALSDCNAAIERNPFSPGYYSARGYVYRQLNRLTEAEADYTQALHFSPENRTYMLLRADTRAQLKQYEEALEDIEQMLRREPQSASVWGEKGQIAILRHDTLQALEAFEKAAQYDKSNPAVWSALGVTNLMLKHEEEAYVQLTQAINLGSKWAGDYINRGVIHYHRHNYRGALSDLDQAVKLSPRDADSYYNRGMMRQEVGDYNHALEDFNTALDLAPERTEMRYQRGLVELQLKQWKAVVEDMKALMERYPYFLPAYYLAAQAKVQQGDQAAAYRYRQKAHDLEQRKDEIQAQQAAQPNTDVLIAAAQPRQKDRRKEFSSSTAQNQTDIPEEESKYDSQTRGTVQKKHQDVMNEPMIVLSYYSQDLSLRRTNYYHTLVDQLNRSEALPAALRFTTQEIALTAEMVDYHFAQITRLTKVIDEASLSPITSNLSPLYLARAIEFAIIKDYASAIDDCTKALVIADKSLEPIICFCRATWRYRLMDNNEFEMILRDLDHVIRIQPDWSFAYYDKANILCVQKEWQQAIAYYTRAIAIDPDFAEAYFNRGLTYIYTEETEKGLADLSKAGELGMYQAYNLITRFK